MKTYIIVLVLLNTLISQPGHRNAHSLVYDEANKRIVLFGGADEEKVSGETWQYKDSKWTRISTIGPLPRTFGSLVYNSKSKLIFLFGGNRVLFGSETNPNSFLNDLWSLNKDKWVQIQTKHKPQERASLMLVYSHFDDKLILFGGYTVRNEQYIKLDDTWEFDNRDWRKVTPENQPIGRAGALFVYDMRKNRAILFGGTTNSKNYDHNSGETWFYQNSEWYKNDRKQVQNIFDSAYALNSNTGEVLRFGGWNGSERISETWIFKNEKWNEIKTEIKPDSRNHSALVYSKIDQSYYLYGGHDGPNVMGDLWQFKDNKWIQLVSAPTILRVENGH